jgi:hypothetical protein
MSILQLPRPLAAPFHAFIVGAIYPPLHWIFGGPYACATLITLFYVRQVFKYQAALKVPGKSWTTVDSRGWSMLDWIRKPINGGWYSVAEAVLPALMVLWLYWISA